MFFLSLSVHEVKRGLRVAASNAEPSSSQITGLRAHSVPSLFRVLASESSPFKKASGWRGQMQGRLVHRGGALPSRTHSCSEHRRGTGHYLKITLLNDKGLGPGLRQWVQQVVWPEWRDLEY